MRVLWEGSRRWLRSRGERWAMAQFALSGLAAVAIILSAAFAKIGVTDRTQAALWAQHEGLA